MAEYDSAIALAKRLIDKKGELVTLRRFNEGVTNPSMPWKPTAPAQDQTDQPLRGVFLPSKPKQHGESNQVPTEDKEVYLAAEGLTFEPRTTDVLVRTDGTVWTISTVDKLDPNGRAIIYTLKVKQ